FRSLIENASDMITVLDGEGAILYQSPAVTPMLGYRAEDLAGKNAFTLVHAEDLPKIRASFSQIVHNPEASISEEFRLRHQDGSWRLVEAIGTNLSNEEGTTQVIINSRDITERKEMERLKDELVSTVSHELRTPLTSLRGFTELMLKRTFAPEKQ